MLYIILVNSTLLFRYSAVALWWPEWHLAVALVSLFFYYKNLSYASNELIPLSCSAVVLWRPLWHRIFFHCSAVVLVSHFSLTITLFLCFVLVIFTLLCALCCSIRWVGPGFSPSVWVNARDLFVFPVSFRTGWSYLRQLEKIKIRLLTPTTVL